jgi:hypothetical protein
VYPGALTTAVVGVLCAAHYVTATADAPTDVSTMNRPSNQSKSIGPGGVGMENTSSLHGARKGTYVGDRGLGVSAFLERRVPMFEGR